MKDGNKNRLRHQDIHKIVDVFTRQLEVPKYARMVSLAEIEANHEAYRGEGRVAASGAIRSLLRAG